MWKTRIVNVERTNAEYAKSIPIEKAHQVCEKSGLFVTVILESSLSVFSIVLSNFMT